MDGMIRATTRNQSIAVNPDIDQEQTSTAKVVANLNSTLGISHVQERNQSVFLVMQILSIINH